MAAESKDESKPTQNIFQIVDELVRQLNRTKKTFLILIVSLIVVVVPLTFIAILSLFIFAVLHVMHTLNPMYNAFVEYTIHFSALHSNKNIRKKRKNA